MEGNLWYLKQFSLFSGFSDQQLHELGLFLEERQVRRMQIVFDPEDQDKVFFIKRGMVEVYNLTEEGKKVTLETLGPGSFFAAVGFGQRGSQFLEATEDTLLCVTTKDRLYEMIAHQPTLARRVVEGLLSQLFEAREQITIMATGSVRDRLIHLLGQLVQKYGVGTGKRVRIGNRFTHEELAHMIGASRETVTKMLSLLAREGVIAREGKNLLVSPSKLQPRV